MIARGAKVLLVVGVALYYTLVALNNITDWDSNYQFVRHVMMMDSTFPGNHEMWRAINSPILHTSFYVGIIAWELATTILYWWGAIRLVKVLRGPAAEFEHAKDISVVALTISLLMWFIAFLTVGGEWFLMWQSRVWNGQEPAFRMFTIVALVLLILIQREADPNPSPSR
jgi:predicted small integral membrane protein